MKPKTFVLATALCFITAGVCLAQDANMGTWKLNEAKSKIPAGAPKNTTVTYEAAGDMIKITVEGVDGAGQPSRNEWTGKFDGNDYPVTGESNTDARAYKVVNARTLTFANKKAGKTTLTGRIVISVDGKSRTVTTTATSSDGKKVKSTAVYDKQ